MCNYKEKKNQNSQNSFRKSWGKGGSLVTGGIFIINIEGHSIIERICWHSICHIFAATKCACNNLR